MKKLIIALLAIIPLVIIAEGGFKEFTQDNIHFGSSALGDRSLIFDYAPDGNSAILSVNPATDEFLFNNTVNTTGNVDIGGELKIGAGVLDASSLFEPFSTTKGSKFCPEMSKAQRDAIATPDTGLCVYVSDVPPSYYQYNGTSWAELGSGGVGSLSTYAIYDAEDQDITGWTGVNILPVIESSVNVISGGSSYKLTPTALNDSVTSPLTSFTDRQLEAHTTHSLKGLFRIANGGQWEVSVLDSVSNVLGSAIIDYDSSEDAIPFEILFNVISTSVGSKVKFECLDYSGGYVAYYDDLIFNDDTISTSSLITRNSVGLEGNDGRAITADTENIPFDGSGVGWTSGGFSDNYYTVQYSNSIIHLNAAINMTANLAPNFALYKNGAFYKYIFKHSTAFTRNAMSYLSSKGELTAGDTISIRADVGFTLNASSAFSYLTIEEKKDADHVVRSGEDRLSEWEDYTPTLSASWGSSPIVYYSVYRRVGDTIHIKGNISTGTSTTAAVLTLAVPSGLEIDTDGFSLSLGSADSNGTSKPVSVWANSSSSSTTVRFNDNNLGTLYGNAIGDGKSIRYDFSVKIVGWTAGMPELYALPQSEQQDFWAKF